MKQRPPLSDRERRLQEQKRAAQERGILLPEVQHSQKRRALWHDYNGRGLYMVTLVIAERRPLFGHIEGHPANRAAAPPTAATCQPTAPPIATRHPADTRQPTTRQPSAATHQPAATPPHMVYTPLGRHILNEELAKISLCYPMVEVWKATLMPDHLHLLLYVRQPLLDGAHLGIVVRGFKSGCTRAWWALQDGGAMPAVVADGNDQRPSLFEEGYHDRLIRREGMLEAIRRYMDENPLRYAIRRQWPDIMERRLHLLIGGRDYAAFGNLFLLKYPDKVQVFFHRRAADGTPYELTDVYAREQARLLRQADEGTVLVTPGISRGEQLVKQAALERGLPLIHLQKEPIGAYWKPEQHRFYACAWGTLLILTPWQQEGDSDYALFHNLNTLAAEIVAAQDVVLRRI